jgi:hypothetical protein
MLPVVITFLWGSKSFIAIRTNNLPKMFRNQPNSHESLKSTREMTGI